MRLAASRTCCTAGISRPIETAMMAMTTSSSMSVNARRGRISVPQRKQKRGRDPPNPFFPKAGSMIEHKLGAIQQRPKHICKGVLRVALGAAALYVLDQP